MLVERSTKHVKFIQELGRRYDARINELVAGGMTRDQAVQQATKEIIIPVKEERTRRNIALANKKKP